MSMWGSSMWVGKAHSTNQVPNFRTYGWTACAAPTLPPPIEPTPLAMPGDDGRRLTMSRADPKRSTTARARPRGLGQTNGTERLTAARTLQGQELMAKSKNLCF